MVDVKEFMNRTKMVNGWFVAKTFVMGAFCGCVLTVLYMWLAVLPK
jgi:hypothetical protein